jgi:manganese/zinc/iron transport system ATP- binding protein
MRILPTVESTLHTLDKSSTAIYLRDVTVSYKEKAVLRSVSMDVPKGEIIGIVGPNGAGKSSLIKTMLGLLHQDAGEILYYGKPIQECRQLVSYVPQTGAVDWDFPVTVLDVVMMGHFGRLGWLGRPGKNHRKSAIQALETVGMAQYRNRHIRQLSGGQQQRVFLARALCQKAEILFLDEPFGGVDAATEKAIFALMDNLAADGHTLVVVNHDLSVLDRYDQLLLLNQHVIAYGPPAAVATEANLRQTYGGHLSLLDKADIAMKHHLR